MTSQAVRFDRGSPVIVVQNRSKIPDREIARIVRALQIQVDRDFFPAWGWRAKLRFLPDKVKPPKEAMTIVIKGKDTDDDEGYHLIAGIPKAYVFTVDKDGEPIKRFDMTLSHEVLEMIADPGANLYALGHYTTRTGKRREAFVAYEVCDPVQERFYKIDGVHVSDFVTPEWFEPERTRGSVKFSHKRAVNRPFGLAPNGYMDVQVGSTLITSWGKAPKKKNRRRHRHEARKARVG